jgi:hypothetical protein
MLLLFAGRIDKVTRYEATSSPEKWLTRIGRGRGSAYFWAALLIGVGTFNLLLAIAGK